MQTANRDFCACAYPRFVFARKLSLVLALAAPFAFVSLLKKLNISRRQIVPDFSVHLST